MSLKINSDLSQDDAAPYKMRIVWRNVFVLSLLHIAAIVSIYSMIPRIHNATIVYMHVLEILTMLGVQAGAHRLWSHRSYKANFGLRLFLSLCHVMGLQNDLYEWCRDHRVHHRYSETDADPHNSKRGFFFAHMGWLMCKKHPDVLRKGATVDLSDLDADVIVQFQRSFYIPLVAIFWGIIPTFIPVYFWGEDLVIAFMSCVIVRYVLTLHIAWSVNSWAHLLGTKPYNANIGPVDTSIRHLVAGEGFHNYHHTFPWDYSASELGPTDVFNPATGIINFFHYMGWAWDLKRAPKLMIEQKIHNSGDSRVKRYETGHWKWEWAWGGLFVSFSPIWTTLIAKYGYLLIYDNDKEMMIGIISKYVKQSLNVLHLNSIFSKHLE